MSTRPSPAHAPDLTDLLLQAWELERATRLIELRALLEELPPDLLSAEPDLGLLLSSTYVHMRDLAGAERTLQRIEAACRERRNDRLHRRYLTQKGLLLLFHGRLNESHAVHTELMGNSLAADDESTLLWSTMHLALIHNLKAEWATAMGLQNRALALARRVDGGKWRAAVQSNFSITCRGMGRLDAALRQSDEAARDGLSADMEGPWAMERAELMRLRGEYDVAESLTARSYAAAKRIDSPAVMANARLSLARLEMVRSHLPEARAAMDEARALLPPNEVVDWGELYEEWAVLEMMDGNSAASAEAKQRAIDIFTLMDAPRRIGDMLQRLSGRPAVLVGVSAVYRG
jgi:ATP/maltotriose-dependent transcriptional regulator MalT